MCSRRRGTAKGARASTAISQRQKFSAAGSKTSRSARPRTQLPAQNSVASARSRNAVPREPAAPGLTVSRPLGESLEHFCSSRRMLSRRSAFRHCASIGEKEDRSMKPGFALKVAVSVAFLAPTLVLAQIAAPRTLGELKAEVQERADRHVYPVSQLEPAEVREALGSLKSLDRDEWAAAWSAIGDRHMAQARKAESNPGEASKHYKYAFEYYLFARFPLENSPGKVKAYEKALEAFAAYAKLQDPAIEIVRIPFEGKEIVGYLRLPKGVRPARSEERRVGKECG